MFTAQLSAAVSSIRARLAGVFSDMNYAQERLIDISTFDRPSR